MRRLLLALLIVLMAASAFAQQGRSPKVYDTLPTGIVEAEACHGYKTIIKVKSTGEEWWCDTAQGTPEQGGLWVRRAPTTGEGETNTASNLGAGQGLFASKSGVDLRFKSLVAGSNVTLTPASDAITIASTGGGHDDGSNCLAGHYPLGVDASGNAQSCTVDAIDGGNAQTLDSLDSTAFLRTSTSQDITGNKRITDGTELQFEASGFGVNYLIRVRDTGRLSFDILGGNAEMELGNWQNGGKIWIHSNDLHWSLVTPTLRPTGSSQYLYRNSTTGELGVGELNPAEVSGTPTAGQYACWTDDHTIEGCGSSSGEANTASNLGAGEGLFATKVGVDLRFKSLVAGSNVTLTPGGDTITIAATGGGGGAPTDAGYWTNAAHASLSAEVVVNSLASLNSAIGANIADGPHTTDTTCSGVSCDLRDGSLVSCDSIDSDASGNLICGTDATGNDAADDLSDNVLADLSNVAATAPATGQVLEWNGSAWAPGTDDSGGGGGTVVFWAFTLMDPASTTNLINCDGTNRTCLLGPRAPAAFTIADGRCVIDPGDSGDGGSVAVYEWTGSAWQAHGGAVSMTNNADTDVITSSLALAAGERPGLDINSITGSADQLNCTFWGSYD